MKPVITELNTEELKVSDDKLLELANWLEQEHADARAARAPQEELWREALRMYEGVPRSPSRDTPILNAPNIEVVVGAIAADSVFAQVLDLVFQTSPTLIARAVKEEGVETANAMQDWINWLGENEVELRKAAEQGYMDNIQLGTGIFYVPWVEKTRKSKVRKTTYAGPAIRCIPPEDFLVPGGCDDDLQEARWCTIYFYLTQTELDARARRGKWTVGDRVAPVPQRNWVRSRREQLGRTMAATKTPGGKMYDVLDTYCHFDIDGDGEDEDLLVTWNQTGRSIMKVRYNPYDKRPIEAMRYQIRPHLFYGLGVLEMMKPFQEGATELYCHWLTNLILANSRIWKAREGVIPTDTEIWPSKVISCADPETDLIAVAMADTYPSAPSALATTIGFAQQRVGVNELSGDRPSQLLGSRTPGITALTAIQQVNKRFTPAFDDMRDATAMAVKQVLWRYQEQIRAGNQLAQQKIMEIMGAKRGYLIIAAMMDKNFESDYVIELKASSASVNREADKQSMVMLASSVLAPYYQQIIQLTALATNPQTPPAVVEVTTKVAKAMSEGVDIILRTFDQIRDPSTFAIDLTEIIQQGQAMNLSMLMQQMQGQGGGMGGPPPGANPPMGEPPPGMMGEQPNIPPGGVVQ
jgi:hypothetical protein